MTPVHATFHALGDPSRLAIVERLSRGPASVKELAAPLPMGLPAVMKHLGVLEAGGLVRSDKAGRVRTYHLEREALTTIADWIEARRRGWERAFDRLEQLLEEE